MSVRRVAGREASANENPSMVKRFHLGSMPTLTSAKADEKLLVGPADVEAVLSEVARRLDVPVAAELAKSMVCRLAAVCRE